MTLPSDGRPQVRPTIHDVAKAAGVSVSTVSHALSGKGTLSKSTRTRVADIARSLNYHPHPAAAGLRGGRTSILGLDIRPLDTLGDYVPQGVDFFLRFAGAAAVTAMNHGYGLMLVPDLSRASSEAATMAIDGYIVSDPVEHDAVLRELIRAGRPVVTVGRDPSRRSLRHRVDTNDKKAATRVLDLLLRRGASNIALISGTDKNSWNHDVETEYQRWCESHDMPQQMLQVAERDGLEGGRLAALSLLEGAEPPDAIYCQTGRHAAGVAIAARESNVSVPDKLMIVAGSDSEQTRSARTPITSIDMRPEDLGRCAVEMLLDILHGNLPRRPRLLTPHLIERATTARR
jgi:DNA-binding LacI/PurR family transcriptional regulator